MTITFPCTQCGQTYQVDERLAGKTIKCRQCEAAVVIPSPSTSAAPDAAGPDLYGLEDEVPAPPLPRKGAVHDPRAVFLPPGRRSESLVETLIPSKNSPALVAYYLGLFGAASSCVPLLGLIMPSVALVMGIKGLKLAKERPEVRGAGHAWVGVICGAMGLLLGLTIVGLFLVALIMRASGRAGR